ncbi:hypothetical protein ACOL20_04005 [Aliarcobacter butzleri]
MKKNINNHIKSHINEVYILLYEAYLEDFMPNWRKYILSEDINYIENLIVHFRKLNKIKDGNYVDSISFDKLYWFLIKFNEKTNYIINILENETNEKIILGRFFIIKNLIYKNLDELEKSNH